MDKRSADRIIVKSNARMEIVLDWFSKNREQTHDLQSSEYLPLILILYRTDKVLLDLYEQQ